MDAKTKTNAISIFKYLEELFSLNVDTRRDFRNISSQERIFEIRNFPKSENLFIKSFNDQSEDLFLSVENKELEPLPKLPKELVLWVDFNYKDFSKPDHKEFILKNTQFSEDAGRIKAFNDFPENLETENIPLVLQGWVTKNEEGIFEKIENKDTKVFFLDFPELQEMYSNYICGAWEAWKKRNEPIFKANEIYNDLYGLRTFLKTESESFDLFWTHDLLTWEKENEKIYHPLFITPIILEFIPEKKKIEIRKDNSLKTVFETSFLDGLDIPNIFDIYEESKSLNLVGYDVWNQQALKLKGSEIVGYLSPNGVDKFSEDVEDPQIGCDPAYYNFQTIILRKKSNIDWAKYAKKIQQDITERNELPDFIAELAGSTEFSEKNIAEEQESDSISDGELYFPLPWNEEQKTIASKIESQYGVVVQGPPGTGKSHTIANLLCRFLAQGKSVLVTSQTGKALEVLKDKIPTEIKDLVVSQIESNSRRDDLQEAVKQINANLSDTTKFTTKKIEEIREQLQNIRKEKALLLTRIKRWVLLDAREKLLINGEYLTPTKAAKELFMGEETKQLWLEDEITKETELNFTEKDVIKTIDFLLKLTIEEQKYFKQNIPQIGHLPKIEEVRKFFEKFEEVSLLNKHWEEYLSQKKVDKDLKFNEEKTRQILKRLESCRDVLNSINKRWEINLFTLILKSKEENDKWRNSILKNLKEGCVQIRKLESDLLGHDISCNIKLNSRFLLDAVIEIEKCWGDKKSLNWINKLGLSKNAKAILENGIVDFSNIKTKDCLMLLKSQILIEQTVQEIKTLWGQAFNQFDDPEILEDNFVLHLFEDRLKSIERILSYEENFSDIKAFISSNLIFSGFVYTDKKSIEKLSRLVEFLLAGFDLEGYVQIFTNWKNELNKENSHKIVEDISLAIDNRDSQKLNELYQQIAVLEQKKKDSEEFQVLKACICMFAPKFFKEIQEETDKGISYKIKSDLPTAWRFSRIRSWLKEIHSDKDVAELQKDLDRITNQEKIRVAELVAVSAWKNQKEKVTVAQRQALSSYALNIKRGGRWTGKLAPYYRKNAQEALKVAKDAVPIWIMSLEKVLHMFSEPKAGMFDVVIFDESSQVDVRGINIAYLGKKLLVVGDPEQISPISFLKGDDVIGLISKHLSNISHCDNFSVTSGSSFFELAEVKMNNRIMLEEHFRSVEEIIGFSNKLSYDGKLRALRYPQPKWQLKPVLEAVHVKNGFLNLNNQVNEPEAEAVVEKLAEMIEDPKYAERDNERGGTRPTTFGVTTLLGYDQKKFITNLIRQKISEEEIEKRKIIAGDPYAFQGDERDIMLISMVKAPDQNDTKKNISPLTINKKENKQRVNVAMSRARDKMVLFHSVTREELNNELDLRAQILDWFYNTKKEEIKWGREALKQALEQQKFGPFEFPFDVGTIILNKGYKVIPEFGVAGKSIDLVIQGENARLAVECDGDFYHTDIEADLRREDILRRAGWEFWRVTSSSFYSCHGERALSSLWKKLDELGIKPII
ncbi:AAA family ATPase [Patescibacteria group bacterium]|nr:AAA family ATPase [Patescibacteria group bacterium]